MDSGDESPDPEGPPDPLCPSCSSLFRATAQPTVQKTEAAGGDTRGFSYPDFTFDTCEVHLIYVGI